MSASDPKSVREAVDLLARAATDAASRKALRIIEAELERLQDRVSAYRSDELERKYGPDL